MHDAPDEGELAYERGYVAPPPRRVQRIRDNDADPLPPGESAAQLLERDMPPVSYLCDPWIPEGLTIKAGRPKLGKTTLLRQALAAIGEGGSFLGAPCAPARNTAFLCLEEGDRLARSKIEAARFSATALRSMTIFYTWPRGADGVLQLQRLLDERRDIKAVGVDSITRFRAVPDARTPAFSADYEAVSGLQAVAKARPGVAIIAIHHTRKAKSDDPLDDISGTYGLTAACDSYMVMRHHEDGAVLHVGGRFWDRDVSQYQLRRGNQRWELVGAFAGLSPIQVETLEIVRAARGISPTQLAQSCGIGRQAAFDRLNGLVRHSVVYVKAGVYYPTDTRS